MKDFLKEFMKNYFPYGCVCIVIALVVQSVTSIRSDEAIEPKGMLLFFGIVLLLTLLDYLLNTRCNFKSYYGFVVCEYLILTGTYITIQALVNPDTLHVETIFDTMFTFMVVLSMLRVYISHVFHKEVEELNAHLKK